MEQDSYERQENDLKEAKAVFAEVLAERSGMKAETLAALPWGDLRGEFEDDEGELTADVLAQNFETGDPGDDGGEDPESDTLSEEDRARIEQIQAKEPLIAKRAPERWEALEAEAAGLAGVDDYSDIELEAL